jgi:hypothetical protein
MKKPNRKKRELLDEYDFSEGIRGKYAKRYAQGTNLVLLEPDVFKIFSTAEAVNTVLRSLAKIVRNQVKHQ